MKLQLFDESDFDNSFCANYYIVRQTELMGCDMLCGMKFMVTNDFIEKIY